MSLKLTPDQLQSYHTHGFVTVPNVFSKDELQEMDAEMDRLVLKNHEQDNPVNAPANGWLLRLGLLSEKTAAFCEDPRILDLVQSVVKPGIAIYSAKLVSKEPHDNTICHWHQDDAYYSQNAQSNTRMSVWIPLQDTTLEQGCLQVIPGSHKHGLQPFAKKEGGTCNLAISTKVDLDQKANLPVEAGAIVLFSALLQHASEGNTTNRRRRAFIISYQEATVPIGNKDQFKILRPA